MGEDSLMAEQLGDIGPDFAAGIDQTEFIWRSDFAVGQFFVEIMV